VKTKGTTDGQTLFWCPGCKEPHGVNSRWTFNGDSNAPTFSPSVLVRSGHYAPSASSADCWCTYNAARPGEPADFECRVCHSFVTDGRIQFLSDCTHDLAGQTVGLPDWPIR
jgi:hypothetical protein